MISEIFKVLSWFFEHYCGIDWNGIPSFARQTNKTKKESEWNCSLWNEFLKRWSANITSPSYNEKFNIKIQIQRQKSIANRPKEPQRNFFKNCVCLSVSTKQNCVAVECRDWFKWIFHREFITESELHSRIFEWSFIFETKKKSIERQNRVNCVYFSLCSCWFHFDSTSLSLFHSFLCQTSHVQDIMCFFVFRWSNFRCCGDSFFWIAWCHTDLYSLHQEIE